MLYLFVNDSFSFMLMTGYFLRNVIIKNVLRSTTDHCNSYILLCQAIAIATVTLIVLSIEIVGIYIEEVGIY